MSRGKGRPKVIINKEEFERAMTQLCLTKILCARLFCCSEDTIERFVRREYNCTFGEIRDRLALSPEGLGRRARLHLINESEKGNFYATKVLLKNYAPDIDLSEETHKIEVSTPTDATVREMEAYFANKKTTTGSDL